MFATTRPYGGTGHDTLPVCLSGENPHRLVSLWEIVTLFNCAELQMVLKSLHIATGILDSDDDKSVGSLEEWAREKWRQRGETELPNEMVRDLARARKLEGHLREPVDESIERLRVFCESSGFEDALLVIRFAGHHLRNDPSPSELRSEIRHLEEALFLELIKRKFLRVEAGRVLFLEQDELFGPEVNAAFPSAARDIKEAGNCLAAECSTGAVFHLMRAAEVALRALAADRGVSYPDAALSSKQVGDLLSALDGKMADMRRAAASLWPSKDVKNAQIKFYHTAIAEFRDFNEAWRKHMAHAHEGAFYDCHQALSILEHVRQCMQNLAPKISENSTTPLCWITA